MGNSPPQQQGWEIHIQWPQAKENMDLGMQDQLHQETEKAGSALEELHVLCGWKNNLLPPPGHLLWGQMGEFYCMPPPWTLCHQAELPG